MTIDYAKRQTPPQAKASLWRWSTAILGITLTITTLLAIKHHHDTRRNTTIANNKNIKHTTTLAQTKLKSEFDFYQMLSNMQVSTTAPTSTEVNIKSAKTYYLLQVATSRNKIAAQDLVTKLGVMGLNASLKSDTTTSKSKHFRVMVGPYINKNNADTDQTFLRSNHINSIELTIKKHA